MNWNRSAGKNDNYDELTMRLQQTNKKINKLVFLFVFFFYYLIINIIIISKIIIIIIVNIAQCGRLQVRVCVCVCNSPIVCWNNNKNNVILTHHEVFEISLFLFVLVFGFTHAWRLINQSVKFLSRSLSPLIRREFVDMCFFENKNKSKANEYILSFLYSLKIQINK